MDLARPARDDGAGSRPEGRKILRYALVSIVFVPTNQLLLQALLLAFPPPDDAWGHQILANLVVASVMTPAFYLANRRMVWQQETSTSLRRDITVFWTFAVVAVLVSSLSIAGAAVLFPTDSASLRALRILLASLASTAGVFVARYLVADRWLFPTPVSDA